MKRYALNVLAGLTATILLSLASPVLASEMFTLHASGAEVTSGTSAAADIGNWRQATVYAKVTAGTGTVTVFKLWIECSPNGGIFTECVLDDQMKGTVTGAATQVDNTILLASETAVQTAASWSARISAVPQWVRLQWTITGTTPSETFQVVVVAK